MRLLRNHLSWARARNSVTPNFALATTEYAISAKMAISYFRAVEDRPDGRYYRLYRSISAAAAQPAAFSRAA
jgi:hypothetical protein